MTQPNPLVEALETAAQTLDVADRLIERGYGMDTPQDWNVAFNAFRDARQRALASHRASSTVTPQEAGNEANP